MSIMRHDSTISAKCPLCEGAQTVRFDSVLVEDLRAEYIRQLGVDTRNEFDSSIIELLLFRCNTCGLEFFNPPASGSPHFYSQLSRSPVYYSSSRWEFGIAVDLIDPRDCVVDVGCGDGFFLSLLPQTTKLGLELNQSAVSLAKTKGLDVRCASLESLPDSSADVLTMFQVLEHIPTPIRMLSEAVRVLRPGGLLLVTVPNNDGFLGKAIFEPLNLPPHHPLRWTAAALRYLSFLQPLNLERLAEEPVAPDHVFAYRRTKLTQLVAGCMGRRLPLMKRSIPLVLLRKIANAMILASMWLNSDPPRNPSIGHSYLAAYRKNNA